MTFLAIDVGNTRLKWALYDQPNPQGQLLSHGAEFLENIDRLSEGAWAQLPKPDQMPSSGAYKSKWTFGISHPSGWYPASRRRA